MFWRVDLSIRDFLSKQTLAQFTGVEHSAYFAWVLNKSFVSELMKINQNIDIELKYEMKMSL